MSEKPQWELDVRPDTTYLWNVAGANCIVLHGPDREANAKLFIAAQHMGELVEAAKEICEMQSNHFGDGMATHRKLVTHCARLRAILAQIGGGE